MILASYECEQCVYIAICVMSTGGRFFALTVCAMERGTMEPPDH